ncbi:hypothetical protein OF83DRAFT_844565 [Amylostereum chailletii]|nr:hypothetical protein OF83DRAFT_844565 [Amylostereum chailletii]
MSSAAPACSATRSIPRRSPPRCLLDSFNKVALAREIYPYTSGARLSLRIADQYVCTLAVSRSLVSPGSFSHTLDPSSIAASFFSGPCSIDRGPEEIHVQVHMCRNFSLLTRRRRIWPEGP